MFRPAYCDPLVNESSFDSSDSSDFTFDEELEEESFDEDVELSEEEVETDHEEIDLDGLEEELGMDGD